MTTATELPEGLTAESVHFAMGLPVEQRRAKLNEIIAKCAGHDSIDAIELSLEAEEILAEMEA